jgi:hypothetical protein
MGLNYKRGRIRNSIKTLAKSQVEIYGAMAYHYACYDCAFDKSYPQTAYDYQLIDCIVKELKERNLW